jgi:hypothetical protein
LHNGIILHEHDNPHATVVIAALLNGYPSIATVRNAEPWWKIWVARSLAEVDESLAKGADGR